MGASFIGDEEASENYVHSRPVYFPNYSIGKFLRRTSLKCTEITEKFFISEGVLNIVYKTFTDFASEELIKQVSTIALQCESLYNRFRTI